MIPERPTKGNNRLKIAILVAIVVLVGVASFGLGRLSSMGERQTGVIIHQPAPGN